MSSASSSTAGSNAANQGGQQSGGAPGGGSGRGVTDSGSEGQQQQQPQQQQQQQQQQAGTVGGGTADPPTNHSATPSHQRGGPATSGNTAGSMATVLRRKTNVCLICGIYTNLSLNIFEPRNGPNIVDVIYEKYKFRAERGDNADKHICFSCNNWLINWYSLQNTSSSSSNRTYEPVPSTSRSSSSAAADSSNNSRRGGGGRRHQGHKSRRKGPIDSTRCRGPLDDKENNPTAPDDGEQHNQVSSTTPTFPVDGEKKESTADIIDLTGRQRHHHPYIKRSRGASPIIRRAALRENNGNSLPVHQERSDIANNRFSAPAAKDVPVSENFVSSSTVEPQQHTFNQHAMLVKPFECRLIRMLEGQGTSVTKECVLPRDDDEGSKGVENTITTQWLSGRARWQPLTSVAGGNRRNNRQSVPLRKRLDANGNHLPELPAMVADEDARNEILLSFDSALSEVIDVVPSLKAAQPWSGNDAGPSSASVDQGDQYPSDPVGPLRQRLSSGVLSMSIINVEEGERANNISW